MKTLFIHEKYCDGEPLKGLTNNLHNLHGSYISSGYAEDWKALYIDDQELLYRKLYIDQIITSIYNSYKPELVVFSFLGNSPLNPSIKSLEYLKSKGCKLVFMYPDLGFDFAMKWVEDIGDLANLSVAWGGEENIQRDNLIYLWAPQDERLYHPYESKIFECSFIGSLRYPERYESINYAKEKLGNRLLIDGGQREKRLTAEQYAKLIRQSEMTINFPGSPCGIDQRKGRVIEAIASNVMLLERKNDKTSKILKPGVEYVEFENKEDLVDQIRYYAVHDVSRNAIALNGHRAYKSKYSAKCFWKEVMDRL